MALVVGLGNPGSRYAGTRHNAGWRVVERLARRWNAALEESDESYRAWRAERSGADAWLMQPLTWMNRSGEALAAWEARHGLDPGTLLVVVDDVYLPPGTLRLRARGSSGGHQGLESIERTLGGRAWARLRIGVGGAESGGVGLREHVLADVPEAERIAVETAVTAAAEAVECWLEHGLAEAMNRFNRKVDQEETQP